ncbi:hypothetical protein BGZ76_007757, partial [Entomortierella beljakovae]
FMQRQQERETREKLEQEQVRVITEAHWVIDQKNVELPKPKFQVEYEPSYLQMDVAERSSVGRKSFQKFNENVEKTATKQAGEQQLDRELKRQRNEEISDNEMAGELGRSYKAKKEKTSPEGNANSSKKTSSNRRIMPPKNSNNNNGGKPTFMKPKE